MTTLSEDIDYLAIETKSESNDGRHSAATWEHEDLAQVIGLHCNVFLRKQLD
jgi:hypothetical protein